MYSDDILHSGFSVVAEFVPLDQVDERLKKIATLHPQRSRAGVRHALRYAAIAEFATQAKLMNLAQRVLVSNAVPFRATLFDKSPQSNGLVVWHQDTALPRRARNAAAGCGPWSVNDGITYTYGPAAALETVLALRVHLDDSTSDNGPLRVLPATHNRGVLNNDDSWIGRVG